MSTRVTDPASQIFTATGRPLRGNVYYPSPINKIRFAENRQDAGLQNFRLALVRPLRMTMQGTTPQRVEKGLENIAAFLKCKVTSLLQGSFPDDEVKEIATRLSTRGQIAAFALAFDLGGLIGVDFSESPMPLDAGDILGLLYAVGYFSHREKIENGLESLVGTALDETVWDGAADRSDEKETESDGAPEEFGEEDSGWDGASEGSNEKENEFAVTTKVDRTAQDIPAYLWQDSPQLAQFLRDRGLTISVKCYEAEDADPTSSNSAVLKIQSIGMGLRRWDISESAENYSEAKDKAYRNALSILDAAYIPKMAF
ncbi:hypothetical protein TWF569_006820 [Orbilia oligospora]|nr:hypothetical protein TWF569_006820 [Orbilia oligospora]